MTMMINNGLCSAMCNDYDDLVLCVMTMMINNDIVM